LHIIRQSGFEAFALPATDYSHFEAYADRQPALAHSSWLGIDFNSDAAQTINCLEGFRPDWLIIDHYAIDQHWESLLRPYCERILVIDDLADRIHDCDLLLDQNLVDNQDHRYDGLAPTHATRLLGPRYALLQSQYAELHHQTAQRLGPVRRIFLYFGGADHLNLTGRCIESFLALERSDLKLDVVVNSVSRHLPTLRQQIASHSNIFLHEDLPSLAGLMIRADLGIGAAGTTTWERLCLGLPSLVVTLAENQNLIADSLNRRGLIRWIGYQDDVTVERLAHVLNEAISSVTLEAWSEACGKVVDGKGADRTASVLVLGPESALRIREADAADEEILLEWANDPVTRSNSFNASVIGADTHRQWLHSRLKRPVNCSLYISETKDGLPIGQVRFERVEGGDWEIHYGLWRGARGKGLGVRMVELALKHFRADKKNTRILGYVKSANVPSHRIFERLGFSARLGDSRIAYTLVIKQNED
jgi:UDP-2,4-diacetamido-2,4,6-trideoxy-beta-L-altropyranose hydrolase